MEWNNTMPTANVTYERSMKEKALIKHVVKQQKAIKAERAGTTHPYNGLVRTMLLKAEENLKTRMKHKGGKSVIGVLALRQTGLDYRTVCAIAARTVVDGVVSEKRIQRVVELIGMRVEDEVRCKEFAKREPKLWKSLQDQFQERYSQDYTAKRQATVRALMKARQEETWEVWTNKTRAELGILLADCLLQAGLIVRVEFKAPRQQHVMHQRFGFPPEVEAALASSDETACSMLKPWYKPMLEPPVPWTTPVDGGYMHLPAMLVKVSRKSELSRFESADMPAVYAAVNAVQATPWKINEDVLVCAEELTAQRTRGISGIPVRADEVKPLRPHDIPFDVKIADLPEESQERLKLYLKDKKAWHNATAKRSSKNIQALQILDVAKELRHEPAVYFPHNLDYRGRMYPMPLLLNPQGNDLAKGLLTFAEGKPLGEMGGFWLAVHGANTWGMDKGPLTQRVDWVLEHEEMILACADDPLSNMWWTEADGGSKPFQFLAFCLEWAAASRSGLDPEHLSYLPVSVDGACNGIQHFSAMLRDPVGARATNLTADPVQHDVYSEVAEEVNALIRASRHRSEADREMAGIWENFGVDRKVVKRPVMTTPYGATAIGMKEMVLQDTIDKNPDYYWGAKPWEAARWLAGKIDQAIGNKLGAAREAMLFIQHVAKTLAAEELPITWVTPAGFPVVQQLWNKNKFTIDTRLLGKIQLQFNRDGAKLDKTKQRSSAAPNFVHSYDGAHLQLTVVAMQEQLGAPCSWAVVHDSFGTHAGMAETLGRVLREQFVTMYEAVAPLEDLRRIALRSVPVGTELEPAPTEGTFDLRDVLKAEFFFA